MLKKWDRLGIGLVHMNQVHTIWFRVRVTGIPRGRLRWRLRGVQRGGEAADVAGSAIITPTRLPPGTKRQHGGDMAYMAQALI